MKNFLIVIFVFLFFVVGQTFAVQDTLILENNNIIVGEIKKMDKGILIMETSYSDDDFTIEWSGISKIFTETLFFISTTDGTRYNGKLKSKSEDIVDIHEGDGFETEVNKNEIVLLQSVSQDIWSRLYASIDLGYSLARANNLNQLTVGSSMNYIGNTWSSGLKFNGLLSSQDDVEPIRRWDGDLTYRFFLPKDWYLLSQISLLSNTEQKLKLRSMGKIGAGNFIIHMNQAYWGLLGGITFNNESYSTDLSNRQSFEGFAGTELNLYDIGDLNLLFNLTAYPSFTDVGRWRMDFNFESKYDLPLDFYIKIALSFNYDNRPVEGAPELDYVFSTGFGWEFDN